MRTIPLRLSAAVVAVIALIGASVTAAPASAAVSYVEGTDAAATLFDPLKVVNVQLDIPEDSLAVIATQTRCNTVPYQDATLTVTTETATYGPIDVGVRLKGCHGSWQELDEKPGWKVKISAANAPSMFGLRKLTFNNMVQDGTQIHEVLAYRLFRAMGVAASRVGYANVIMNNTDYGLYANIETLDKVSLPRWYGANNTLHLYEGGYGQDATEGRASEFEIDEGDESNISDLESLANANSKLEGSDWWSAMQNLADLEQMTAEWATEHYLRHWDGYITRNNYYFHSTLDGKFTMLPWGLDQTFAPANVWEEVLNTPDGVMYQRCMEVVACKSLYAANVVEVKNLANSLRLDDMASNVGRVIGSWGIGETRSWISERRSSLSALIGDNRANRPSTTVRRDGGHSVLAWGTPHSHGVTVNQYQVGFKRNGVWGYRTVTTNSFRASHPAGKTLWFKVRAHTAWGWSEWSVKRSITRR